MNVTLSQINSNHYQTLHYNKIFEEYYRKIKLESFDVPLHLNKTHNLPIGQLRRKGVSQLFCVDFQHIFVGNFLETLLPFFNIIQIQTSVSLILQSFCPLPSFLRLKCSFLRMMPFIIIQRKKKAQFRCQQNYFISTLSRILKINQQTVQTSFVYPYYHVIVVLLFQTSKIRGSNNFLLMLHFRIQIIGMAFLYLNLIPLGVLGDSLLNLSRLQSWLLVIEFHGIMKVSLTNEKILGLFVNFFNNRYQLWFEVELFCYFDPKVLNNRIYVDMPQHHFLMMTFYLMWISGRDQL